MRAHRIADHRFHDACVLVVDDEPVNARLLARILADAGYRNVITTTDPHQVVDLVLSARPAVLLLDLRMPGVDGFAILEQLRHHDASATSVPVLILTGDSSPEVRHRALNEGAEDFVTKPFDPREVLLRIHKLLESTFLHADLAGHNRRLAELVAVRSIELAEAREAHQTILSSLARLQASSSPEETAATLCSELVARAGFESVAIFAFAGEAVVLPLAAAGGRAAPALMARPLPVARGRYLRERSAAGPWAQEWDVELAGGALDQASMAAGTRAALCAPITSAGRVLGVLCAGSTPGITVDEFSHRFPTVVDYAAVAGALLAPALVTRVERAQSRDAVAEVIASRGFVTVFQPIVHLEDGAILGFEALTRFSDGTRPDVRFTEAYALGMGVELEEATLRAALAASVVLPASAWLSLNASPDLLLKLPRLRAAIARAGRQVVLEVTEHVRIEEYGRIRAALDKAGRGIQLAIDDAGAGFNSFRHIVELSPDYVKLDLGIVRSIEEDPMRQALVTGLRYFAAKTGCTLIAEGIETENERTALLELGVAVGQGDLMGRPAAMA